MTFPVPPLPYPIFRAFIFGTVGVHMDFGFGFDTSGLRQFQQSHNVADVFNGFYFDDHVQNGVDLPEIRFFAGVGAGAEVDLFIPIPTPWGTIPQLSPVYKLPRAWRAASFRRLNSI